jgi:hypothetical protein
MEARDARLDLIQTTACGRFRVTVESFPQGDVVEIEDAVRSLADLARILDDAATLAIQLAQLLLEKEREAAAR